MDTPLIPEYLMEYLDGLVPPRPAEMQAMEAYAQKTDFPIIGPASGNLCYQVARMIGARRVRAGFRLRLLHRLVCQGRQ